MSASRGKRSHGADRPQLFTASGQIIAKSTPNVNTTTQNLADLVAFTRALQWARFYATSQGKPILLRPDSEYAARIASGAWKARKHKDMALEARRAWAALKRSNNNRVWMQHATRHTFEALDACKLAERGKSGSYCYSRPVD